MFILHAQIQRLMASLFMLRVFTWAKKLGQKIAKEWADEIDNIDVVIPVPETSTDIALQIARVLGKPYRQGFVKKSLCWPYLYYARTSTAY